MRRKGFSRAEAIFILLIVCFVSGILYLAYSRSRYQRLSANCAPNQKQIALCFLQYQADNSGNYPLVATRDSTSPAGWRRGWAEVLFPYSHSTLIFQCPIEAHDGSKSPSQAEYTDYWYNRRLAGINQKKLTYPLSTILTGDGNDGTDMTNARYSLSTLPAAWRTDKSSPAYRHLEGANYAFADGHVKWLKPAKVTNAKPTGTNYTFAIR